MVAIYKIFILICFLFFFGACLGWTLELFYRRFISKANPERKWLNPGFLTGPYLPLYGFGVVMLFFISFAEQSLVKIDGAGILHWLIMFIFMAGVMTVIEYIAGIVFICGMNIKLWDYSNERFNVKGIICLKFSIIWGGLSMLYYFFVYPHLYNLVLWFMEHPFFSFIVGIVFGIFIVDSVVSLNLGAALKKAAKEIDEKAAVDFQKIQRIANHRFFVVHNFQTLSQRITKLEEFIKRSPDKV